MKLATSNLIHNLGLGLAYQKQRLGPKLAGVWTRGQTRGASQKIWDPLLISATVEANNFKFDRQLGFGDYVTLAASVPNLVAAGWSTLQEHPKNCVNQVPCTGTLYHVAGAEM